MGVPKKMISSGFGYPTTAFRMLLKDIKKYYKGKKIDVCEIGSMDGTNSICLATTGFNLDCYELNEICVEGGWVEYPTIIDNNIEFSETRLYGLRKRLLYNSYRTISKVNINKENFFTSNQKQYDFIFVKRTLDRDEYSNLTMGEKINSLKSSIKEDGTLYIEYFLKEINDDSKNSYLKFGQMKSYFNIPGWKILYCVENKKSVFIKPTILKPFKNSYKLGRIKVIRCEKSNPKLEYYKVNVIV